jgi:hypothetical protein
VDGQEGGRPSLTSEGVGALAELESDAPGVAKHDEHRAVGLGSLDEEGGPGGFEAGAVGAGVGDTTAKWKTRGCCEGKSVRVALGFV